MAEALDAAEHRDRWRGRRLPAHDRLGRRHRRRSRCASIVLFLIIFLWTPPHFWALALYKQGDYGAAGIPMLPNVAGEQATKVQILVYSVILVATSLRARPSSACRGCALHRGRRRDRSIVRLSRLAPAIAAPMRCDEEGRRARCSPIR